MAVAVQKPETELVWAARSVRELLRPLPSRLRHTVAVVESAVQFGSVLTRAEFDVLTAAAYVHDIGYAAEIAETGFHPLDGARFVRAAGRERLAGLVAHHSASDAEAEERSLTAELDAFPREDSIVARALDYCDLTTGPDGERLSLPERLAELEARVGADSPIVRAVRQEMPRFLAIASEMESLLKASESRRG